MSQLILRVLCAIFLLIGVGYQTQVGAAQQADADWYKRVAPEKCISYVAWNNDAEKVIEGNATQELMADPDVRAFVDDMKKRVGLFAPDDERTRNNAPGKIGIVTHAVAKVSCVGF